MKFLFFFMIMPIKKYFVKTILFKLPIGRNFEEDYIVFNPEKNETKNDNHLDMKKLI